MPKTYILSAAGKILYVTDNIEAMHSCGHCNSQYSAKPTTAEEFNLHRNQAFEWGVPYYLDWPEWTDAMVTEWNHESQDSTTTPLIEWLDSF